jgi:hypothetical protein
MGSWTVIRATGSERSSVRPRAVARRAGEARFAGDSARGEDARHRALASALLSTRVMRDDHEFESFEQEIAAGGAGIIDLTARTPRTMRKGTRRPGAVDALVLHQMACCFRPRNPLERFRTITAHFAITADGRILQLHPTSALLWASNGFNARSVAVEFAGNFPSTRGQWWQGDRFGRNQVTQAQVDAGRRLIRHLQSTIGIRYVFAHRQASAARDNDPGPDLWFNVGQWAIANLGMSDGGPGFRIGTGNPIPDPWRAWARPIAPELGAEFEAEQLETELAHDAHPSHDEPAAGAAGVPGTRRGPRYAEWLRAANARAFPASTLCPCGCGDKAARTA